ncbi:hypothetical protein [Bosea sp. UC22_33]|uniref:hypothetical protein n=1 Tax=Bosea sp. UC22_33 TaxID=3350165 RepID=UPI00366BD095
MPKWVGRTSLAAMISPLPIPIIAIVRARTVGFSWEELPSAALIFLSISYGFVVIICLPVHALLHKMRASSLVIYMTACSFAIFLLLGAAGVVDAIYGAEIEIAPDDNSPFAGFRFSTGALLAGLFLLPIIFINTTLFWLIAVRLHRRWTRSKVSPDLFN